MTVEKKSNAGRKGKYATHVQPRLDEIVEWCKKGLTEAEICKLLGVGVSTFAEYKNEYVELLDTLKEGKSVADDLVEQALYNTAIGYDYMEQAVTNSGEIVDVRKYSKPNTTAQIFWLKNRRKDQWREKQDVELSGGIDVEINLGFDTDFDDE